MMTVMNGDEVEEPGEADIWTYDDLLNVKRLLRAVFFDDVHPHTHSSLCMIET